MVLLDNGMNGTGAFSEGASSSKCPVGEQRRPGHHPATARMMWNKDVKRLLWSVISKASLWMRMECQHIGKL